jgi:membrane protease YdiL (CAAX protease family)
MWLESGAQTAYFKGNFGRRSVHSGSACRPALSATRAEWPRRAFGVRCGMSGSSSPRVAAGRQTSVAPRTVSQKPMRGGMFGYFKRRIDPLTSLVLTTPVFLLYHVGLLLTDARNGVDFISGPMRALAQTSLLLYLALTLAVAVGIVVAGLSLRERNQLHPRVLIPVLVESAAWAFVLSLTVGYVTTRLFAAVPPAMQTGAPSLGPIDAIVMSAGAGFHEELVFRVGLFTGGALLLARLTKMRPAFAVGIAAVVSSLIFSAAHYIGPFGDSFLLVTFTFRALFGLALAGLYRARGFAIAVYTHAIYDVFVFTMAMIFHR